MILKKPLRCKRRRVLSTSLLHQKTSPHTSNSRSRFLIRTLLQTARPPPRKRHQHSNQTRLLKRRFLGQVSFKKPSSHAQSTFKAISQAQETIRVVQPSKRKSPAQSPPIHQRTVQLSAKRCLLPSRKFQVCRRRAAILSPSKQSHHQTSI